MNDTDTNITAPQATLKINTKPNSNFTLNLEQKTSRVISQGDSTPLITKPDIKLNYYDVSDLINSCVNYISETGALTKFKVGVLDSNGILVYHKDKKLMRLFNHAPNSFVTWQELLEQAIQSYLLAGNTYFGFEKLKNYELWALNPDEINVVPHRTKFIEGYLYKQKIKYKPNEMVHVRRGSIQNMFYGTSSTLDVLEDILRIDGYATQDIQNFYKNGSNPSGVLSTEYPLNETQIEDLRSQFKAAYGGKKRMSTLILPIGMDFKPIKVNPKDSQLLEALQVSEDRVLKVFKLPNIVLGGNNISSYPYTIAVIYKAVFDTAILPIVERIRGSLELFFREAFKDDEIVIEADYSKIPYMASTTPEEAETAVKLFSSGLSSANEMRENLGLPIRKEEAFNSNFVPAYLMGSDVQTLQTLDPTATTNNNSSPNQTPSGSLSPNGGDTSGVGNEGNGHMN